MRELTLIVVHQLGLPYGDAILIDKLHRARSFSGIGYHYLILGSRLTAQSKPDPMLLGQIQPGRPLSQPGAHCRGFNKESIGICLIGNSRKFYVNQIESLKCLVNYLRVKYNIPIMDVVGHYELDPNKRAYDPGFKMGPFREYLKAA